MKLQIILRGAARQEPPLFQDKNVGKVIFWKVFSRKKNQNKKERKNLEFPWRETVENVERTNV